MLSAYFFFMAFFARDFLATGLLAPRLPTAFLRDGLAVLGAVGLVSLLEAFAVGGGTLENLSFA